MNAMKNVAAGTSCVTATARDDAKSQIFLDQGGSDTFTGGSKGDVMFAGGGSDSLDGGSGNDQLYGGTGSDSYSFTGSWGRDLVLDSDASGSIQIDGAALGKAKAAGRRNVCVADFDGPRWAFKTFGAILIFGGGMTACAKASNSWTEEALLHDGRKIMVTRSQSYGGRSEPGQSGPIKEHSISFASPGSKKTLTWTSEYDSGLGRTNFNLLAVHVKDSTPYIVASPNLCLSYNKWGRPNPPYVIFKYENANWQQIAIEALPTELKTVNMLLSIQKVQADEWSSMGVVSSEKVRELNAQTEIPEFRTILREPLPKERIVEMCGDRVLYKGHWIVPNSPTARSIVDAKQK